MARPIRLLLGCALLASCSPFRMQHEQVFVRYQAHEDVLDILFVCEGIGKGSGIFPDSKKEVETAVQTLQGIRAGHRHFLIWSWPLDLDIESIAAEDPDSVEQQLQAYLPQDKGLEARGSVARHGLRAFLPNIELLEARFLTDEKKGLCLVQRVRVRNASDGLRLLDESINLAVQLAFAQDDIDEFWTDDARSLELLRARVEQGGSWARFDGGGLDVSVPMTAKSAARLVKEALQELQRHPDGSHILGWMLGPLESLSVTGEELCLRFAPSADGWIRWDIGGGDIPRPESVTEALSELEPLSTGSIAGEVERLKAFE